MTKIVVSTQIAIILSTILLGAMLNNGVLSGVSQYHALFGRLSAVIGFAILILSFVKKASVTVKAVSMISVLLIIGAALSGKVFSQTGTGFWFILMVILGICAFISNTVILFTINKK